MRKTLFVFLAILVLAPWTAAAQHVISTIAGGGPNNMPARSANLMNVMGAVKDSSGNLYIADAGANRVYRVDSTGLWTVYAGNGMHGYKGDGGAAVDAELAFPLGLCVDGSGNLFISDEENHVVREVVTATGIIQTVAGNGTHGYSGDGGAATSAQLYNPSGLFIAPSGTLYISDSSNNVIRAVANGAIQTVAGTGTAGHSGDGGPATSAQLNNPYGLSVDTSGNVFFADYGNFIVREIVAATGIIQTVAGNGTGGFTGDGGPATSAQLYQVTGVSVDRSGNLFIADMGNEVIREVSGGVIQTVAGIGQSSGYSGDGGPATSAQLDWPHSVFVDSSGNLYISDFLNKVVREVTGGTIQTYAGSGLSNFSAAGPAAADAFLGSPWGVVFDAAGNTYFTAFDSNMVGKVLASTGQLQVLAGNGQEGYAGDGGPAASALLIAPTGVARDSAGNVFFADQGNHRIREIVAATGIIQTVAGNGGYTYTGDGGPATSAEIGYPTAVSVDGSGNIFFGDWYNNVVREVLASNGNIQTVAGTGYFTVDSSTGMHYGAYSGDGGLATAAELNQPFGVSFDASGNIFISDSGNNRIREVTVSDGKINTVVGNGTAGYAGDGGAALSAELNGPDDVLVDAAGNIFIADVFNNAIREVVAATGNIQTVAGTGVADFSGDGGPATSATIQSPASVTEDPYGNFVLADMNNNRIRSVAALAIVQVPVANLSATSLDFGNQLVSIPSNTQQVTVTNNSTQTLNITSIALTGANVADFVEYNGCGTSIAAGNSCAVSVYFTPLAIGTRAASVTITDDASNSPQSIALTGTGTPITSTTGVLASLNPSTFGQSVTFTASVSGLFPTAAVGRRTSGSSVPLGAIGVSTPPPSGTITFLDGSTQLGRVALDANGQATYSTAALAVGTHPITASYSGDTAYAASTSSVLSQVVNAAPDYTLTSPGRAQTVASGGKGTYSIVVTPTAQGGGSFNGTVTFSASGMPSGCVTTFTPTSVVPGSSAASTTLSIQTPAKAAILPLPGERPLPPPLSPLVLMVLAVALLAIAQPRVNSLAQARMSAPRFVLLLLFLAGVVMGTAACNGGFGAPAPASVSYTVTVTATSGSVVHTTNLSLTVQ
jgi:sugar lactone lactonase YvrE